MKLFIVLSQKYSLCWSSVYARIVVLQQKKGLLWPSFQVTVR